MLRPFSPYSYYRTDLLIQYKSTKMKNPIPDWKYTEGRIGLQKAAEFHEEEVWILLTVFTSFYIYVALYIHQTVLEFPSHARAKRKDPLFVTDRISHIKNAYYTFGIKI